MIKKKIWTIVLTNVIVLLPLMWGIVAYASLPNQIPIHFNLLGEVDCYGPKWIVLLISPILLFVQWVAIAIACRVNKVEDAAHGCISWISWACAFLALAIGLVLYNCASGNIAAAFRSIPIIVGLAMVVSGNYMPKQKRNRWIGVRTKWTLSDPDNWMKTNRFFGKLSVLCGLAMIGLSFVKNLQVVYAVMFVLILVPVFVPLVYSYRLSRRTKTSHDA